MIGYHRECAMLKLTVPSLLLIASTPPVFGQEHARVAAASWQTAEEIDWKQIRRVFRNGVTLGEVTPEDSALWRRASELIGNRGEELYSKGPRTGLTPLSELGTGTYRGEVGGLYGAGRNDPPAAHRAAAITELARIRPLDGQGRESPDGKVILLSIGMSNTTQWFSAFKEIADGDPDKAAHVLLVDGAQDSQAAGIIADDSAGFWQVVDERLKEAGASAAQVQVAWVLQATPFPHDPFPVEARMLYGHLVTIMKILRKRFPNLRIAYHSSRIYGGYANSALNPEPHAYESAFAVRWLILDQIRGHAELNYDPEQGRVRSPLLLWGPYLWADGLTPRRDGLVWEKGDLAGDGTHLSESGQAKVAGKLLDFFKTDPLARTWFLKAAGATP